MIPYFYVPTLHLGPFTLQTWGLMVSIGAAAAIFFAHKQAKRFGLDHNPILDWAKWLIFYSEVGELEVKRKKWLIKTKLL